MNGARGEVIHSLGMTAAVLVIAVRSARASAARRRERAARERGERLLGTVPAARARWWCRVASAGRASGGEGVAGGVRRWAVPAGGWLTGWLLVGGVTGCVVGSAAALGAWRWQRSRPPRSGAGHDRRARALVADRLPLAADLLAACIAVGAGPREAAEAVGESIGGPVGDRLVRAAAEIRLGGEPAEVWGRFGEIPGAGSLARCLHRAGSTGAPAAEPVARLAEALRAERADAAVARAQRAGVLITAPVGLCFLPAFLTIGVVPVIIGLAGGLLGPG
ncbi:type II secretion system F family protein [Streptomyces pratensis]|uniref:type II secretion system F family protein n=1 Tax=Streptomyces pratensis TaxID=1169025 RepID=UPI003018913A